ncbi:MAG: LOG family protein [Candidatus Hodarchaeales archaeon]|jgi:uncharacterized protein (TIGR00725 family)
MQTKYSLSEISSKYSPIASVFGSSACLEDSTLYKLALDVGKVLTKHQFTIASGGYSGVMDGASKGAKYEGGKSIGITTDEISFVSPSTFITEEFRESSLMTRLELIIGIGDIYIFLPGSSGTLTELALVWDKQKLNLIPLRPIILFGKTWHQVFSLLFDKNESIVPLSSWKKEKETSEQTYIVNTIEEFDKLIEKLKIEKNFV